MGRRKKTRVSDSPFPRGSGQDLFQEAAQPAYISAVLEQESKGSLQKVPQTTIKIERAINRIKLNLPEKPMYATGIISRVAANILATDVFQRGLSEYLLSRVTTTVAHILRRTLEQVAEGRYDEAEIYGPEYVAIIVSTELFVIGDPDKVLSTRIFKETEEEAKNVKLDTENTVKVQDLEAELRARGGGG